MMPRTFFTLFILIIAAFVAGCADHAHQGKGAESIAYQERHQFALSLPHDDKRVEPDRILALVNQFDLQVATFELSYPKGLRVQANQIHTALLDQYIRPERIRHLVNNNLNEEILLVVSQWKMQVEQCQPYTVTKKHNHIGCWVESNRALQTVNPGRATGEVE